MDVPLWGDTGGHTGAAPTKLHHTFTHNTSGAEMHRALPPPLLKIKKCVYRYDFGVTADDVICFKTSYDLGVTVDGVICFKTSYSLGVTVASP